MSMFESVFGREARSLAGRVAIRCAGAVVAILGTAVGGRIEVDLPGTPVPQSAQTLAVLLSGIFLGPWWGGMAMGGYLIAGGFGLPVFAGGGAGTTHLLGPTAGYLIGFVAAAVLAGWSVDAGYADGPIGAVSAMLAAHAGILILGWARLAWEAGFGEAFATGVAPFLSGAVLKSLLAAGVAFLVCRARRSRRDETVGAD